MANTQYRGCARTPIVTCSCILPARMGTERERETGILGAPARLALQRATDSCLLRVTLALHCGSSQVGDIMSSVKIPSMSVKRERRRCHGKAEAVPRPRFFGPPVSRPVPRLARLRSPSTHNYQAVVTCLTRVRCNLVGPPPPSRCPQSG